MPPAPPTSLIDRFFLENPWPIAVTLLLIALVLLYSAVGRGSTKRLAAGFGVLVLAVGVFLLASFVSTPAEHGERVTQAFVADVVVAQPTQAAQHLSADADLAVGSTDNPGMALSWIRDRLTLLTGQYPIRDNYITQLDAYTKNSEQAVIHLTCLTTFDTAFAGPTKTSWVLFVNRQTDGTWKIRRITIIQVNDQAPTRQMFAF